MKPLCRGLESRIRAFLANEDVDWAGRDDTEAALAAAMEAMAYWRERSTVDPEDVAREGVTPAKRTAYLRTVATEDRSKYRDYIAWTLPLGGSTFDLTVHRDVITDDYQDRVTARVITDVARGLPLSPWAILDAMASMDPDDA